MLTKPTRITQLDSTKFQTVAQVTAYSYTPVLVPRAARVSRHRCVA